MIPSNSCNVRGECCLTPSQAAFVEMLVFAETLSNNITLADPNSPQYKAVEWLAQDKIDHGSNWSGYELLQRYVLRVLYVSTNGDNWSNNAPTTWFVGGLSVCQWPEVNSVDLFCNGNGQQVDRIDLGDDNLQGEIPSQLGQLTALTDLSLFDNQLTGTIPIALTQLTNLEALTLYNNNLTGQVPSGFCAAPFPDWRADGWTTRNILRADCMSEVQCDCCDICFDESGNLFCWYGSGFTSNSFEC